MASAVSTALRPIALIWGDDDFAVKQRARQIYQEWCAQWGGLDHEIIDASAAHSGEALAALRRLREAVQTLPFFGSGKVIWFRNCNFLGDERTASAQAVAEALSELAQELKKFPSENVRLLITSGGVDKRRTFYKTLEKIGTVEAFAGWSLEDRNWAEEAESCARRQVQSFKKKISRDAVEQLVAWVGPNARQLASEVDKLISYAGNRDEIGLEDVNAVVTRNKQSRAFALGDAFGARDLPKLLRTLDEELWGVKTDSRKSEIGLLYGLISKVRVMIFLKEMQREGWIKGETDYNRFKAQLERVPVDALPQDRRFSPLSMNPYVLFKTLGHARQYSLGELIEAMEILLECNRQLIFSNLDEALVLQQALIKIVSRTEADRLP
ncbi:MAG: DNA polymerase III subunit delta [Verrucomicrobia bacterium]|nr:DNA polymerase III subunit delta [Verrucomicrobiota bacterium]